VVFESSAGSSSEHANISGLPFNLPLPPVFLLFSSSLSPRFSFKILFVYLATVDCRFRFFVGCKK
jgi:hypothetical protein